jgi:hypothetical protein
MPALRYQLIRAIFDAGLSCAEKDSVDPSVHDALREAGVALVTTHIEQLSLLGLVIDPTPLFGRNGGMWIGYSLSPQGREAASSEQSLRMAVAELIGGSKTEVSQSIAELQAECEKEQINEIYRQDFLRTLEEIRICFDEKCYIAAIGLCGKILEVCLKETLLRNGIQYDPNSMVGTLIKMIREKLPGEYLDPSLMNVVNIINTSRITAVHAKESIPIPSRDQSIMVIFATRDVVRRNLSYYHKKQNS